MNSKKLIHERKTTLPILLLIQSGIKTCQSISKVQDKASSTIHEQLSELKNADYIKLEIKKKRYNLKSYNLSEKGKRYLTFLKKLNKLNEEYSDVLK